MRLFIEFIGAYIGSLGFGVIFNIRGRKLLFAAFGGAAAWVVYSGLAPVIPGEVMRYLLGTIVAAAYAEILARVHRVPVTLYLVSGIMTLVPGNGIYTTMKYCISGESQLFLETGLHTFAIAGALALGIVLVATVTKMITHLRRRLRGEHRG